MCRIKFIVKSTNAIKSCDYHVIMIQHLQLLYYFYINLVITIGGYGPMDKASDYESGDSSDLQSMSRFNISKDLMLCVLQMLQYRVKNIAKDMDFIILSYDHILTFTSSRIKI
ncbi:hypothetical protein BD770DRAFT_407518 [Pilaira anomala]|nr:hypothetical protein BD770DRAFT_407518 [Pilaira anomala]